MDIASIIGLVLCLVMVVFGILDSADYNFAAMISFADFPSLLITVGGSLCAVLTGHSMQDFLAGLKSISLIFKTPSIKI